MNYTNTPIKIPIRTLPSRSLYEHSHQHPYTNTPIKIPMRTPPSRSLYEHSHQDPYTNTPIKIPIRTPPSRSLYEHPHQDPRKDTQWYSWCNKTHQIIAKISTLLSQIFGLNGNFNKTVCQSCHRNGKRPERTRCMKKTEIQKACRQ